MVSPAPRSALHKHVVCRVELSEQVVRRVERHLAALGVGMEQLEKQTCPVEGRTQLSYVCDKGENLNWVEITADFSSPGKTVTENYLSSLLLGVF